MSSDAPPVRAPLTTALHVIAYLVGSLLWVLGLNVVLGIGLVVLLGPEALVDLDNVELLRSLGPGAVGLSTLLQGAGLVLLAALLGGLLPSPSPRRAFTLPGGGAELLARLRRTFALLRSPASWVVAGSVGALTVGWFPSWIADRLIERMPEDYVSMLEVIPELLMQDGAGRWVLIASVVLGAPILEELVFRGYLWDVMERAGPPVLAWLGTSLLFALYHTDPVHILALIPTALFIGWLRWVSGSIWPSMAAHFVNNALSVVLVLTAGDAEAMTLPLPVALTGLGFTVAVCAGTWAWRRRRQSEPSP